MGRNELVFTYVGLAIRARKVSFGVDGIISKKSKPFIVLIDNTLGESGKDKLNRYTTQNNISLFVVDMEKIYPNKNCKALGIYEKNLALTIKKQFEEK